MQDSSLLAEGSGNRAGITLFPEKGGRMKSCYHCGNFIIEGDKYVYVMDRSGFNDYYAHAICEENKETIEGNNIPFANEIRTKKNYNNK